jgi:predicted ATPase
MKLSVENLGPIKQGDFELNDLTILVGPNNSGKTYLVTALCAVLDRDWLKNIEESHFTTLVNKIVDQNYKISINEFNINMQNIINTGMAIKLQISSYFGSQMLRNCKVEVSENEYLYSFSDIGISLEEDTCLFPEGKNSLFTRLYLAIHYLFVKSHTISTSERQGISLFYKELYQTRFDLVDILQKSGDLSELISRSSKLSQITSKNLSAYLNLDDQPIIEPNNYVINILKSIIGGEIKKHLYQDIRYYTDDLELSMHEVSSSIRSFVDIYLFLTRKKREPNELLIIDEPESHLTLDNQRVLARLLVAMVNDGIKVLISTHSDFLVKEVNNLILLHGIKNKDGFLRDHPNYTDKDQIDPEHVSLYEFGGGTITKCKVTKRGVESPFIDKALTDLFKTTSDLDYLLEEQEYEGDIS